MSYKIIISTGLKPFYNNKYYYIDIEQFHPTDQLYYLLSNIEVTKSNNKNIGVCNFKGGRVRNL